MKEYLEVFAIEDALHKFEDSDLCNAALGLLQSMNYPTQQVKDLESQSIEYFIYLTVPNKMYYSSREMVYLKSIDSASFIFELRQKNILDDGKKDNKSIVFLAIELNSSKQGRSEDSYYIAQILRKTYQGYVVLLIRNVDCVMLCTCINDSEVCMSEWYEFNSTCEQVYPLLAACYPNIYGVRTIKEFYYEFAYNISREYIKHPESYEYLAYECISQVELDLDNPFITRARIKELADISKSYYKDSYGDDYVVTDKSFEILAEENDEWSLLELDDGDIPELETDNDNSDFDNDMDEMMDQFDISDIDEETFNDPIKLLKWIEEKNV